MELDSMITTAEVVLMSTLNRHYYTASDISADRDNINNEDGSKMDRVRYKDTIPDI